MIFADWEMEDKKENGVRDDEATGSPISVLEDEVIFKIFLKFTMIYMRKMFAMEFGDAACVSTYSILFYFYTSSEC